MSTLKVSEIIATGETAGRAVSGVAAAWVNFDGTGTVAIRDSMNVASITDQGTGAYDANFSSNMANDDYVTTGFANAQSVVDDFHSDAFSALGTSLSPMTGATTSNTSIGSYTVSVGYTDSKLAYVVVHGDQA